MQKEGKRGVFKLAANATLVCSSLNLIGAQALPPFNTSLDVEKLFKRLKYVLVVDLSSLVQLARSCKFAP